MSRQEPPGTFWPSALQEQLLAIAFGEPASATAAWKSVQPQFVLDDLERGSFELLPLIHRTLTDAGCDEPVFSRLKGVRRKTWVANTLLVERAKETATALRVADIPALFIDGVMLAERFYPELGLRPSSWVDVLVRDAEHARALRSLAAHGWREPGGPATGGPADRYLFDEGGNMLALRTTLAIDFAGPARVASSHAPLWESAEPRSIGGADFLVTTPTDTLLAVCVSHARASGGPATQWIADAKMLLGAEIDWERLVGLGVERGQTARLRDAFGYLGGLPGPRPPQAVIELLDATKVTYRERLVYRCTSGSIAGPGALPTLAAEHLAATAHASWLRSFATFPGHLRDRWHLRHSWQVPVAAARRALRLVSTRYSGSG